MKQNQSSDDLLVSIRRYTAHLGRPPTVSEVEDDDIFTSDLSVYHQQFGSWIAALTAAKIGFAHSSGETTLADATQTDLQSLSDPDWARLREQIITFDGEVCQYCGTSRSTHRSEFNTDLHVHQIAPLTQFCVDHCEFDANPSPSTLITLCRLCHAHIEKVAME